MDIFFANIYPQKKHQEKKLAFFKDTPYFLGGTTQKINVLRRLPHHFPPTIPNRVEFG